jgi:hypothetical protein
MARRIDLDTTKPPGTPGQLVIDGVDCSQLRLDWAADSRVLLADEHLARVPGKPLGRPGRDEVFYGFYLDGRRLYDVAVYRNGEFFRAVPERDDTVEDLYRLLEAFWPRDRLAGAG